MKEETKLYEVYHLGTDNKFLGWLRLSPKKGP